MKNKNTKKLFKILFIFFLLLPLFSTNFTYSKGKTSKYSFLNELKESLDVNETTYLKALLVHNHEEENLPDAAVKACQFIGWISLLSIIIAFSWLIIPRNEIEDEESKIKN